MHKYWKYKLIFSNKILFEKIPKRILKFNRPKWDFLKRKINLFLKRRKKRELLKRLIVEKKKKKITQIYKKPFSEQFFSKSLTRLNKLHKYKYLNKNIFYSKFYCKQHSKIIFKKQHLNMILFEKTFPFFTIDVLLWYLNFSRSVYHSRILISNNIIHVNNKSICSNYRLKKDDILSLNEKKLNKIRWEKKLSKKSNLRNNINLYIQIPTIFSFIEIDYYTKSIIILKDWFELTSNDLILLLNSKK